MAYPSYAPIRQQRRRRWLLAILIALIIVAIVALAVTRRNEARGVADYLSVAHEVAASEAETAASLETMLLTITDVQRPEVMRSLEEMRVSSENDADTLAAAYVPPAAGEANGYLVAALGSWTKALGLLDDAIVLILDEPAEAGGTDRLEEAFDLLRIGDLAYAQFLEAANGLDDSIPVSDLDEVAFTSEERAVDYDAQVVTLRLTSVYKLGELHDVSVTAITEPEPLGERDNIPVVPHSERFVVQAVVANQGNEPESQVSVNLELIPTGGGEDRVTVKQTVASLEPGQAKTLVFDTLELEPGGLYELVITTGVDKDDDPENDAWRMVFYRNENA